MFPIRYARARARETLNRLTSPATHFVGQHRVLLRTAYGRAMYVDARDQNLTPTLLLRRSWELGVTEFFRSLIEPGMVVADVGANVGWYVLAAADLVGPAGRIVAFEANPEVFELLHANVVANDLLDRCEVHNVAVLDHEGVVTMYCSDTYLGGGSVVEPAKSYVEAFHDHRRAVEVPGRSLDDVFAGRETPDIVRMDIEGAEQLAFAGMRSVLEKPSVKVLFELSSWGAGDATAFLAGLAREGFRYDRIDPRGRLTPFDPEEFRRTMQCELYLRRG